MKFVISIIFLFGCFRMKVVRLYGIMRIISNRGCGGIRVSFKYGVNLNIGKIMWRALCKFIYEFGIKDVVFTMKVYIGYIFVNKQLVYLLATDT